MSKLDDEVVSYKNIIITNLDDDDLTDILSRPVHRKDIYERIKHDYITSKSRSYRRPSRLPRKITRRKRRRRSSSF